MQKIFKTLGVHYIITFFLLSIAIFIRVITIFPTNENISRFDSGIYRSIAIEDYFAKFETGGGNTGFFPLFPWIWKVLQTDYLGIAIFNLLLTLIAIVLLVKALAIPTRYMLLYLSLPSFVFFYLPLSEATFFFFSSFILIGLGQKKDYIAAFGFLMASLARPSSVVFIPALVILYAFFSNESTKERLRKSGLFILSSLIGLAYVVWYQWYKTGIWFVYFQTQRIHAGRFFSIPSINFTTWGFRNLWNDGFALWAGLFAALLIFSAIFAKFSTKWATKVNNLKNIPNYVWFSILFIAGMSILNVIANPKVADGKTTLMAENRYVFANPFFFVAIAYFWDNIAKIAQKWVYAIILTMFLIILSFCDYHGFLGLKMYFKTSTDIPTVLFILGVLTYYCGFAFFNRSKEYQKELFIAIYIINLFLQIYLFQSFMEGEWIG